MGSASRFTPMLASMVRSGLIIDVPVAEPAVGDWRRRLDPQTALGIPPHVTVLFPFVSPDEIDDATIAAVDAVLAPIPRFDFQLTRTAWFGDEEVLWLAPEPAGPFQRITTVLAEAFPDYPPYGGQFDGLVPHLTIGTQGTGAQLREAAAEIQQQLPIPATADAVTLMTELPGGRWERRHTFILAGDG